MAQKLPRIRFNLDMQSIARRLEVAREETAAEEPVIVSEEPVVASEEPAVVSEEPVVVSEEPVVASEEPVVASEAPAASDSTVDDDVIFVGTYQRTFKYQPKITCFFKPALRAGEIIEVD